MRRRTLIIGLAATVGAGSLAACTAETAVPASASAPVSVSPSAVPILGSLSDSTLAPVSVSSAYRPPPGRAPANAYAVGRQVLQFSRGADRPLPTTVWYPAGGTPPATGPAPIDNASPAQGTFPLVIFSHGLTSQPSDYAAMLARWAQAGFIVAGPTYPFTSYGAANYYSLDIVNQPADASAVLDSMLALAGPLGAAVDAGRIAAAGHSGGGITTVGLFTAKRDERLKAGVVLAGTDFQATPFSGSPAAMLFIHGRKDETVQYRAGHAVYAAVPWSRAMLSITDGGHVTGSADFEATTSTATEFLRWALYGDEAAKARIPGAAAVNDVATLENEL